MADREIEDLKTEMSELRGLLRTLVQRLEEKESHAALSGIPVKTSDLMNGFQGALAKATKSQRAGLEEGGESIGNYVISDLEIEFAAPMVAERSADEPILYIPNLKSVTENSPMVRLKFKVSAVPPEAGQTESSQ